MTEYPASARRPGSPEPVTERLYELLPAFLRYRDQSDPLDSPLRALMAVLERQYTALDRNIQGLYDDWFIETCQDWIAPYLGDLLGIRGLDRPEAWVPGQRTRIANELAYRRLKGTPAVLEKVARDVTGWVCVARPFFERLSINQSLEHVRPGKGRTVDVRDLHALARFGGPFDTLARRPQISGGPALVPAASAREGHNVPNLGLYFWRLQSYPVRRRTARKISPGCYTVHPLGIDQPLFSAGGGGGELTDRMTEGDVPGPLTREVLAEELDCRRKGKPSTTDFFGSRPAVEIIDPRTGTPLSWRAIEIADLGRWRRPEPLEASPIPPPDGDGDRILVTLDPELGRLAFAIGYPLAGEVEVSYHYGSSGDIGGGPYDREDEIGVEPEAATAEPDDSSRSSNTSGTSGPEPTFAGRGDAVSRFQSLRNAIAARPADADAAVIQIVDDATYGGWIGRDLEIELRPGASLVLVAAQGTSPAIIGNLRVVVHPGGKPARLALEGLTIGGKIVFVAPSAGDPEDPDDPEVAAAHRCQLEIRHCTLMSPDRVLAASTVEGGIELEPGSGEDWNVEVRAAFSILGPVRIPADCGHLTIRDSVVDGGLVHAFAGSRDSNRPSCPAELRRTTILGPGSLARIVAEDSIFTEPIAVTDAHLSRVRHCHLPEGSNAGRLEKCQPPAPTFTSLEYGQPGYAQLAPRCAREILTGASNGSEIGAFSSLGRPFREDNLAGILEEYMPWGLEPRIFHVT